MTRVFLSHSSRDNVAAGRMKEWLEAQGFEAPFLDFDKHSGIPPGVRWERKLYDEIERSQALLILFTANWNASKWCFAEFTQARALGKVILPVIESSPEGEKAGAIPAPDLQCLDLRVDREAGLAQLARRLTEIALSGSEGFPWDPTRPPYPGLPTFQEEDAAVFFGRREEVRQLIERLTASRTRGSSLVLLLGASGSGKSSLLRAGVLPRLRRAGRQWILLPPFRPQRHPCQELARALALGLGRGSGWRELHEALLAALGKGDLPAVLDGLVGDLRMAAQANEAQVLITIDQGEELFGEADPEEARRFLMILSSAMEERLPLLAVMSLRSEFLGQLQSEQALTARFEEVPLAPMPMARIPEVIEGPAQMAGLRVDPELVEQAARDAETQDALPLLAFTLRELYDRFGQSGELRMADYSALGDPAGGLSPLENAVRRRADEELADLRPTPEQLSALRDAFVPAMVRVNEAGDYVRRAARWDDLPAPALPLLQRLVDARLLTSWERGGRRVVEVAHEALLRKWPRMRAWLDEEREFLIGSQQLEQDLRDWQQAREDEKTGALLSGLKLARARHWLAERPDALPSEVRTFVEESLSHAEAQRRRQKRERRLRQGMLLGLAAAAVAIWQYRESAQQARIRGFAAEANFLLANRYPLLSMVNAVAALGGRRQDDGETLALTQTLTRAMGHTIVAYGESFSSGQKGVVRSLLRLRNGEWISAGQDGSLRRWRDGKPMGLPIPTGQGRIYALVEGEEGAVISAGENGTLRRWRSDGSPVGEPLATSQGKVYSLVDLGGGVLLSGGEDGTLRRWRDGTAIGPAIPAQQGSAFELLVLRSGEVISGGKDGSLRRWRSDGSPIGGPIRAHDDSVISLAELPGGEVVSGGLDGRIRRWKDGRPLGEPIDSGQQGVGGLVSLPGGELMSAGRDGTLRRWRNGKPFGEPIVTEQQGVWSLAALGEGTFVSGGTDGSLRRWRIPQPRGEPLKTGQGGVKSLAVHRGGGVLSGGADGSLRRWSAEGLPLGPPIPTGQGRVWSLLQLGSGVIVSGGSDGSLRRWSAEGQPLGPPIHTGKKEGVTFLLEAPPGVLISGGMDGTFRRWDGDGRPLGDPVQTEQGPVTALLSTRSMELISAGGNGTLRLWSLEGKEKGPAVPSGQPEVLSLVELGDGLLVSGGADGTMRWWKGLRPQGEPVQTGQEHVWSLLEWRPGELLSAGEGGTVRFWRRGDPTREVIWTGQGPLSRLVTLPNGTLVSASEDDTLKFFPSAREVLREACLHLRNHPRMLRPELPEWRAAGRSCRGR